MKFHKKGSSLKYLLPIILISLIPSGALFAAGSCAIQEGPSKELAEYIQRTDTLLESLAKEAGKHQCEKESKGQNSATETLDRTSSKLVKDINQVLTLENFSTSSRFYIDMVLKSEIPPAINRDHELIKFEQTKIQQLYSAVYSRCAEDRIITSNLSTHASYDTSGKKIQTVLSDLLDNNIRMLNLYRETVLWDSDAGNSAPVDLILVEVSFTKKLNSAYGPKAFEACVKEQDYFKRIKDAINRIGNIGWGMESGIQEWKNAWKLLNGNLNNYAEIEKDLLRNELWKQGVGTKGVEIMLNNLATYNGTYSKQDGVSGFVASVWERVYQSAKSFETVYQGFKAFLNQSTNTVQYMERTQELEFLQSDLNRELIAEYTTAKSLIGTENQTTDQNIGHLIDMHIMLQETIKQIRANIPVSEKVCNSQYTGMGNCQF